MDASKGCRKPMVTCLRFGRAQIKANRRFTTIVESRTVSLSTDVKVRKACRKMVGQCRPFSYRLTSSIWRSLVSFVGRMRGIPMIQADAAGAGPETRGRIRNRDTRGPMLGSEMRRASNVAKQNAVDIWISRKMKRRVTLCHKRQTWAHVAKHARSPSS